MSFKNKFFLAFCCLLSVKISFAQEVLSLEQAIKIGLENNFQIQLAKNSEELAKNNNSFGNAGFLPKLDLTFNTSKTKPNTETTSNLGVKSEQKDVSTAYNTEFALTWTLFDGFKMFATKEKFELLENQGELSTKNTLENTVVTILKNYYDVVLQQKLVEISKKAVSISEKRFQFAKTKNAVGQNSTFDLYNAQLSLNNDKATLLSRELSLKSAKNLLNVSLARDTELDFLVSENILLENQTGNFEEFLSKVFEQNKELQLKQKALKIGETEVTSAKSGYFPKLFLTGKATELSRKSSSEIKGEEYFLGFTASLNLWNGNTDKIKIENAKIGVRNAEIEVLDLKNKLKSSLETNLLKLQTQTEIVKLQQENLKISGTNLSLEEENYRLGNTSSLNFRDAQVSYVNAETNLISAKYQAKITELELQKLVGVLKLE
ncbi:TolC family protein [bacterium]|nr:TolC family protein [bacterium]